MNSKNDAPLVGENFSGPKNNGPRKESLQRKESPEVKEDMKPEDFKAAPKTKLSTADKAKVYRETLEELDIPIEKARGIMDEVVTNDFYIHHAHIGKLKVGLRTRVYSDLERLMRVLEEEGPSFPVHTDDVVARYNVAASLAYFGDKSFDFPAVEPESYADVEAAFGVRLAYLRARPIAVINRLITETQKFDLMIAAIFAEGAPEDF